MITDPSSSVVQARRELGARLRQLRRSAGLTGQAIADATGQHVTRISRIENGKFEVKKRIPKEDLAKNMPLRHDLSKLRA